MMSLILIGIQAIAQLAANPIFGLGGDGKRVGALLELLAKYGLRGNEAFNELKAFTDEIQAVLAAGARVNPDRWDEVTARRHADFERIKDA